ncbi:MAG: hypothetical protein MUO43_17690 [Desulfobacterales bacterium]|nr:hypothetical protein [Desulfobacterales bacterium]
MVDFDNIIDKLDNKTLRDFHKKLSENGFYQGILNLNEIDETDSNILREHVKVGVQGPGGYEKLMEIGPDSIKKEIESINAPIIVPEELPTGLEPQQETETKEKLIQELIHISDTMIPGIGVPAPYRDRYGEIITALNEKYSMTQLDIQRATQISNKAIARAITQHKKSHPIERPDTKVVGLSESKVAQKLTGKVVEKADEIIEGDMELAIHIRETYLKEAYMRGIGLMELVDTAIPIWFNIEGIYTTMINTERDILTLKELVKRLETENSKLSRRNTNLNQVLIARI